MIGVQAKINLQRGNLFIEQYSSAGRYCFNVNRGRHSAVDVTDVDRRLSVQVGPVMSLAVHDNRPQGILPLLWREMRG